MWLDVEVGVVLTDVGGAGVFQTTSVTELRVFVHPQQVGVIAVLATTNVEWLGMF